MGDGSDIIEGVTEAAKSWFDNLISEFATQIVTYLITVLIVGIVLVIISIVSKGKIIKLRRVIKIIINAILGYAAVFIIGAVGGLFTGGAWTFVPKWFSWILIGVFGLLGVIFLIVTLFVWPEVFVTTSTAAPA